MSSATNTGVIGQMRKQAVRGAKVASTYIRPFSSSHGVDDCEDEYRSGEWDYLANDQEAPRFHLVAGLCMRTNPTPRVLEIGCGEGLLPERLSAHRYTEYVGVDAAREALFVELELRHELRVLGPWGMGPDVLERHIIRPVSANLTSPTEKREGPGAARTARGTGISRPATGSI